MSETIIDPPRFLGADTSLAAVGLSLAVIVCLYVAVRAYKEFVTEGAMKSVMYDETGISGTYDCSLPSEEKVVYNQVKGFLLFLNKNGVPPDNGAKLQITMAEAKDMIRNKFGEEEKKKLKMSLVKWMIAAIEILARVERDRPGAAKLYDKNLVSDEYWDGVQECFSGVHRLIKEISAEAEFIEEGWGSQIFQQALELWRITKVRERSKEQENERAATPPSK